VILLSFVGAPQRGSSSTAMLSGIPASLASLNLCTHRPTVARPQPTAFAIPRCVVPWFHSAMILVRVTCRVVGPNGEAWFVIRAKSRLPRAFNTCFRTSSECIIDLQKELSDKNDVVQDLPNPRTWSMQDVEHPSSWTLLYVPFPAAPSNLASSDITWNLRKRTDP